MNIGPTTAEPKDFFPQRVRFGARRPTTRWLAAIFGLAMVGCAGQRTEPQAPSTAGPAQQPIQRVDIENAQRAWCDALLAIGSAPEPRRAAEGVLDSAYNYAAAPVLFKPTLTYGKQTFRFERQGALAYFVGGDPAYPDDKGFALKGWKTCRADVREVFIRDSVAIAMGNVYFTDGHGGEVMVDKTFGYVRDGKNLKIVLHHSSLPYKPEK
jgi:hypothetical protein